jgi:hypothetical protein
MRVGHAKLDDILLLFIYLELGTMTGIYFKTDRLPVLFLLYVAITAITRFMAVDMKELPIESLLAGTAAILVLSVAALVLQVAATRFSTVPAGPGNGEPQIPPTRCGNQYAKTSDAVTRVRTMPPMIEPKITVSTRASEAPCAARSSTAIVLPARRSRSESASTPAMMATNVAMTRDRPTATVI